jgi:tripartite-type tricarboxylate transporter receptor subunit TctC
VVENKTGANGNVGADFVAKSTPDGCTPLPTDVGGLVISASVYPSSFNPLVSLQSSWSPTRRTCWRCIHR